MLRFLAKRLGIYLLILLGVTIIIFALMMWMPGDPYSYLLSDPSISTEYYEQKVEEFGLNDPVFVQYVKWLGQLVQGNLGYTSKGKSIANQVLQAMGNTLLLTIPAFLLSSITAISLGILSALHSNKAVDHIITLLTFLEVSIPTFFLALFCIKIFSYDLNWLPASGLHTLGQESSFADTLRHMILPVCVLALSQTSSMLRYTRSSMADVMHQDYIRTACAKGLTPTKAVLKHGTYNALLPVITVFCMRLPGLLSGALFTETVFVWPGIGLLNYNAILSREYGIVIAIATMTAILIIAANFLADILYAVADPRIRLEGRKAQ